MIPAGMPAAGRYAYTRDGIQGSAQDQALVVTHTQESVILSGPDGVKLGIDIGTGYRGRNEAWATTPRDNMADPRLVMHGLRNDAAAYPHVVSVIDRFVDAAGPTDMTRTGY